MLTEEFEWFKTNHKELFEQYPNKYVVIKDKSIKDAFNSFEDALKFASENFELGSFLVQMCSEGEEGYTQKFHSRVIFA